MRLIVGVDAAGYYRSALTLLARLDFFDAQVTLVHVDERENFAVALPTTPLFTGKDGPHLLHSEGQALLDRAREEAVAMHLNVQTRFESGVPGERLMAQASDIDANLLVIGSRWPAAGTKSALQSVERLLVDDFGRSFLVTHGKVSETGPVHAVFATDHSGYADMALERFLKWTPKGLQKITLVTAVEPPSAPLFGWFRRHQQVTRQDHEVVEELWKRSRAMADRICDAGFKADILLPDGEPSEVLRNAMHGSGADLLVMGARGHSLTERWVVGSVAQEQVVGGEYPVMVIRTSKA